jgi:tetratricopeptide (TPR) repeat protein
VSVRSRLLALALISSATVWGRSPAETRLAEGTVSVEELSHPLSGKALRTILDARRDLHNGRYSRGMDELRRALQDPEARPYAISMLGVEHLKSGELAAAISELTEAVRFLPGHPENQSNLAYALDLAGKPDEALPHARKALQLDPGRAQTRLVLGLVLMHSRESEQEGLFYLRSASADIPRLHLALADYYQKHGQSEAAERERQAYRLAGAVPATMGFQDASK